MKKSEFNAALRTYSSEYLSPTPDERNMVSLLYDAVKKTLGGQSTIQIGSFARFTAIRPLHDLDVLYVAGDYHNHDPDPHQILDDLKQEIDRSFENPTDWDWSTDKQTHSITISFKQGDSVCFSIDIVPAYRAGQNEYGQDKYVVPEVATVSRSKRAEIRAAVARGDRQMGWILSDPRGYTQDATNLNAINPDFRKAAKILKGWRHATKDRNGSFALKSFHIEQSVYHHFSQNPDSTVFDCIFEVARSVPDLIRTPRFQDRANEAVFIDEYVRSLTTPERDLIDQATDYFLVSLERITSAEQLGILFSGELFRRAASEDFLFDQGIPTLTEEVLGIRAEALQGNGFRQKILDAVGWIAKSRKIHFRVRQPEPACDLFKWKVKNDNSSPEPRGEITDTNTRFDPESTKFIGSHYVECYAIRDGVCVARAKQMVRLNPNNTEN